MFVDSYREKEGSTGREGREVVGGEPEGGFEEVRGDGGGVEEFDDWLAGERGLGDFFEDDTDTRSLAEGNSDDMSRF